MEDADGRWWLGLAVFVPIAIAVSLASLFDERFPPAMAYVAWMFTTVQAFRAGQRKAPPKVRS